MKGLTSIKLITGLIIVNLCFGCACFPKKQETTQYLNKGNINALNGTYGIKPIYASQTVDSTSMWYSERNLTSYSTLFKELDSRIIQKEIDIEEGKMYGMGLEILNEKIIKLKFIKEDSIVKQKRIGYRLKDDGYLYLKNNNFKMRGIPYLLGDFNKKRSRITLNKENNLLFETSEFSSGGLFFLKVYPIAKMKYEKVFERIE